MVYNQNKHIRNLFKKNIIVSLINLKFIEIYVKDWHFHERTRSYRSQIDDIKEKS